MAWNPELYEQFAGPRLRPGFDLIARIPDGRHGRIVDLGCGTGALTAALKARWPGADVTGLDSSSEMLAKARGEFPDLAWVEGDIATWSPDPPPDLILSNAALHWLPGHEVLFPHLVGCLAPGGTLAVQMPRNFGEPSHALIGEVAAELGLGDGLGYSDPPVGEPGRYHALLSPLAETLDIWETSYIQALTGDDPVLEWNKSTGLRPTLEALGEDDRARFLEHYAERLRAAYPRRGDGVTLFPFRRLFIVATIPS